MSSRTRRVACGFAAVACSAPLVLAAPSLADARAPQALLQQKVVKPPTPQGAVVEEDDLPDWRHYLAAATRYCEGQVEPALAELSAWDLRFFNDVRQELRTNSGWTQPAIQCAAMLHTELALRARSRTTEQTSHLNWARQLLKLPAQGQPFLDQSFRRDWLVAVSALLHGELRFTELDDYLQEASRAFPDDAAILFAWGLLREAQTSPRLAVVAKTLPGRTETSLGRFPNRSGALRDAEFFYRRALGRDPSLVEAKLRLGHVLAMRGRPDDALAELAAVRDSQATPRLVYLAALFAGRVFQEARRLSEAEASYRVAAPLYPKCQVALTALSHVAFLSGNRDRAASLAMSALSPGLPDECEDPWMLYDFGRGPEAETLFERLRARLRP